MHKFTEHSLRRFNSYKFEVQTVNTRERLVRPHLIDTIVYGPHISYVENEIRVWRFKDKDGYFTFCTNYRDYMVNDEDNSHPHR